VTPPSAASCLRGDARDVGVWGHIDVTLDIARRVAWHADAQQFDVDTRWAKAGGKKRMTGPSPDERRKLAKKAAAARGSKKTKSG